MLRINRTRGVARRVQRAVSSQQEDAETPHTAEGNHLGVLREEEGTTPRRFESGERLGRGIRCAQNIDRLAKRSVDDVNARAAGFCARARYIVHSITDSICHCPTGTYAESMSVSFVPSVSS